jgi:hypothetical protein
MTSEALAPDHSEMRTPSILYPETSVTCSPIWSRAACFAFLTISEPSFILLELRKYRVDVICRLSNAFNKLSSNLVLLGEMREKKSQATKLGRENHNPHRRYCLKN